MRRFALGVAVAGLVATVLAVALPFSRLQTVLDRLGPELVRAVRVAGEILSEVARPSVDDLIKNRRRISTLIRTDLLETTESISQLVLEMRERKPLSIKNLDPKRQSDLLRLVPPTSRSNVEEKLELSMTLVAQIYEEIKTEVRRDSIVFDRALVNAGEKPTEDQINELGRSRGALTANLGNLVQFSGLIQELAFVN
jgi:hypothetical protein